MAEPLEAACALVGRFQYHFGRVEQKIDQAVIKLLERFRHERVGAANWGRQAGSLIL
jgi:hypothetical protein